MPRVRCMQESASRGGRPGSSSLFPGSALSTVYRAAMPANGENRPESGEAGSAREYVRPSSAARSGRTVVRPLSASRSGREDAARPSYAWSRPASSETKSHGYSTPAGSRPYPWGGGMGGQVEILVNEQGEPSPELVSTSHQFHELSLCSLLKKYSQGLSLRVAAIADFARV